MVQDAVSKRESIALLFLKILHVVNMVAPRYGGAGIAAQLIARYQAKAGHKVTLLSTNVDFPNGLLSQPTNTSFIDDGYEKRLFSVQFRPLLLSIPFIIWLKRKIYSFDIIHIHGLYRFPVTCSAMIARIAKLPYVISPHGSLDPFIYKQSHHNLLIKRLYENLFEFNNLRNASAIHYTAKEEAKQASFLNFNNKSIITPIGINWEKYGTLYDKGLFRKRFRINMEVPLVLFLGRINFVKGLDLLIPSFYHVIKRYPYAQLAIVGPDNEGYGTTVRSLANQYGVLDKIFFIDHLSQDEVVFAYTDADVFVLPSYSENFGITVVEAMACACPVVISNQVKIWPEIQEDGAGIVVNLEPSEIANAICQVLSDTKEGIAMGDRGRFAAYRRYSWPQIVEDMIHAYRILITKCKKER